MNKQLEEAIKELKRTIEENNIVLLPYNEQFFNKKEKREIRMQNIAIETVLQALDNSIPKQVIEEKLKDLEKQYQEAIDENSTQAFILKCQTEILKELLKSK